MLTRGRTTARPSVIRKSLAPIDADAIVNLAPDRCCRSTLVGHRRDRHSHPVHAGRRAIAHSSYHFAGEPWSIVPPSPTAQTSVAELPQMPWRPGVFALRAFDKVAPL